MTNRAFATPVATIHGVIPEATPLHAIVRANLETFLASASEDHGKPLPRYVEAELREYLACGILAHGFTWSPSYPSASGS